MEYNRRVTDDIHSSSNTVTLYVNRTVAIAAIAIVCILLVGVFAPALAPIVIPAIGGIALLVVNAYIALTQKESAKGINGRMEQVIAITGEKKRLEAVVDTLAATTNPEVAHLTTASKDAQAAIIDAARPTSGSTIVEALEQIEQNTAQTAVNTKPNGENR